MKQVFSVSGMTCAACQAHVEKAVSALDGVQEVRVDLLQNRMTVAFDEAAVSSVMIEAAVKKAGYGARADGGETPQPTARGMACRLTVSVVFLVLLMTLSMGHMVGLPLPALFHGPQGAFWLTAGQLLLLCPILWVNRTYFTKGFPALFRGAPTMDSLIAVGSAAALLHGVGVFVLILIQLSQGNSEKAHSLAMNVYLESAGMILTLVTVGKYLESRSKSRTADAISRLVKLAPTTATVLRDGRECEIPAQEVCVGDTVVVRAGQTVPVDGTVVQGSGAVDEAAITGESLPVEKLPGDTVTGATLCRTGYFTFTARHVGEDTALARIIRLVEEASSSKAPISRLADRVAGVFVPVVLGLALLTLLVWLLVGYGFSFALSMAISVVVISCPCALGLATPTAIMVGTGKGAEHGVLIKSAESLELMGQVRTVVLDKTGTLTRGTPALTDVCSLVSQTPDTLLTLAASLEHASEHPLSEAVTQGAVARGLALLPTEAFEAIPGKGIRGTVSGHQVAVGNARLAAEAVGAFGDQPDVLADQGKTPLFVLIDDQPAGLLAVADSPKPEAAAAVARLHALGIETVMLTGDNARTARAVCRQVGISRFVAEVLPQDKEAEVRRLQAEGKKVAMIGDGINDAPALTAADVGVAIGAGTDVAMDCADVILVRSSLWDAVTAFRLSRATIRNIKENLFWAFFYNLCGIPLAAGVFYPLFHLSLNPMFAAAAMSLSSLFVVGNALRLRRFRPLPLPEGETAVTAVEPVGSAAVHKEKEITETGKQNETEETTVKKVLTIEGMMCQHCRARVETALSSLPGVTAQVDLEKKQATVTLQQPIEDETLAEAVKQAGYTVTAIV